MNLNAHHISLQSHLGKAPKAISATRFSIKTTAETFTNQFKVDRQDADVIRSGTAGSTGQASIEKMPRCFPIFLGLLFYFQLLTFHL